MEQHIEDKKFLDAIESHREWIKTPAYHKELGLTEGKRKGYIQGFSHGMWVGSVIIWALLQYLK